jgi:hypothetical protein
VRLEWVFERPNSLTAKELDDGDYHLTLAIDAGDWSSSYSGHFISTETAPIHN